MAGTAYKIMTEHEVGGLYIDNHTTTLPLKKGLSSSAAVCVLVRPAAVKLTRCSLHALSAACMTACVCNPVRTRARPAAMHACALCVVCYATASPSRTVP